MFPEIVGFPPKSSILIGVSTFSTIHFGVFPLFLETSSYSPPPLTGTSRSQTPPNNHQLLHFVVSGRLRKRHGRRFQEALEEGEDGHAEKEIGCRDDAEKLRYTEV